MSILESVRGGVSGAINFVVDKNRKIALISKIKRIIHEEENHANQAYIALGKYYFHNLRDEENNETEFYCVEIDHAERRIQRAEMKLEELTQYDSEIYNFDDAEFEEFCRECEEGNVDNCAGCTGIPQDWDFSGESADADPETSGIDVELPPQVQEAMEQQKEAAAKPEEKDD